MANDGLIYSHLVYFRSILSILSPFCLFYGHLVYFTAIWYILWPFGLVYDICFPVLECYTDETLATLVVSSPLGCIRRKPGQVMGW
jgi:hypothetical protein